MQRVIAAVSAVLALAALSAIVSSQEQAAAAQTKPNIIVVMVDDARYDDIVAAMPEVKNRIGAANGKGQTYSNFYDSLSLCCPARATFLTGQYAHSNGIWDNIGPNGGWARFHQLGENQSLATWLDPTYETSLIGKYLNGYGAQSGNQSYIPAGWDRWAGISRAPVNYHNFDVTVGSSSDNAPGTGTVQQVTDAYSTWNLTGRMRSQLNDALPSDTPLFMWLSFIAPHANGSNEHVDVAPEYEGTSNAPLPESAAFDEVNIADKPSWIANQPRLSQADEDQILHLRRERREALKSVDDSVSELVDILIDHGELSNTVLMFVSDNGYMLGEHRWPFGKRVAYEESARVPLMVRGPGFTSGTVQTRTVNVDLAATIADIAGVTAPWPLEGRSLLAGPAPAGSWRAVYFDSPQAFSDTPVAMPAYDGLRTENWVYLRHYQNGFAQEWTTRELYDLQTDPDQTVNKIGDPSLSAVKQSLEAKADQLKGCTGQQCVDWWTSP